jgi:hypothetical protein
MRSSPLTGHGSFGIGLGTFVLLGHPAVALHAVVSRLPARGRWAHQRRINHFSAHPIRYPFWTIVTKINPQSGNFASVSLTWVGIADG